MPNLTARDMLARLPVRMAAGGEARAFSDDEVKQFINSTYAQFGGPGVEAHKAIADAMAQYGVGANQVARVTGYTPREVEAEFMGQRAGQRPVLDDPTGTAAGMSAAYRAAAQAGGQQTVDDYYANLRADAAAYLANPNAPTGVDAYNLMVQSGISTSDLKNAGVADAVLNKIFTVDAPIAQSQFTTPAGMTSAYVRSPDLAYESQRLTALGQDGRGILDTQGRNYIAGLQQGGIDAAERAQMLEYATERGYSFDDLLKAGVDPNVLFTQKPKLTGGVTSTDLTNAVAPTYNQSQLQNIINNAQNQPAAAGTVANPIDTRGSAATGSQSGVSKFLETYNPAAPFVAPAYTAPTVYAQLPTQPDIFAAGQTALDQGFRDSAPRTAIPGMPGQFDYTPAAKLRSATGAGYTWTPPSVTSRPRSLLSPREIQGYGGTMSASQRFAQNRSLIDRNLRDMISATPALRNASTYNLLRNRVMAGEFGADPARVFDPTTAEGQRFQALVATLAGTAQTAATGAATGTVADAAGTGQTSTAGTTVAGGYAAPIDADELKYGGYRLEAFSKGGAVNKNNGVARYAEGGAVSAADLLRQLEGIDNAPSARTPEPEIKQTESRSMLDRLKAAGRFLNQGFYETVSKPAVGTAVDMTVGLGDLAQMGGRYLGNRAGLDAGEFTSAAQPIKEALGVEDYNPYSVGGLGASILPFATAGRAAAATTRALPGAMLSPTGSPSAARQLQGMFPNLGRESGAYVGGETAAAAAREVMPGSTAAELLAGVAGGMGGGFGGSALDAPTMSRIDAPTGDEPPAGSAASMLDEIDAAANVESLRPDITTDIGSRKRVGTTGKYVGAPEGVRTPQKLAALTRSITNLAKEGEFGKFWYERSGRQILDLTNGNKDDAEKIIQAIAITSANTPVAANFDFAIQAYYQWKNGQPIETGMYTTAMSKKLQKMFDGEDWAGRKTNNFYNNLMRSVDPSKVQGVTTDLWMMRAFGFDKDAPTDAQYSFVENETKRIAQNLGWEPQQVQAAIWVALKSRMENSGVKKAVEEKSLKNGWLKYDENGDRVILDKNKHAANWLDTAMKYSPNEADRESAKFDYANAAENNLAQVSWESIPSRTSGHMSEIFNAPRQVVQDYHTSISKAFLDDNGNDLIAVQLGILSPGDFEAPGYFEGLTSPGTQTELTLPRAYGVTRRISEIKKQAKSEGWEKSKLDAAIREATYATEPAAKDLMMAYAAARGILLKQDGVGMHRPSFFTGISKPKANGIQVDIGRPLTADETSQIARLVAEEAGHTEYNPIGSPNGVRFINFDYLETPNLDFHKIINKALGKVKFDKGELYNAKMFGADTGYLGNNWTENLNGEGYLESGGLAGRPDLQRKIRDIVAQLAPRVSAVEDEFSNRYGWTRNTALNRLYEPEAQVSAPAGLPDPGGINQPPAGSKTSRPVNEQLGIDRAKSMVEQSGYRWNDVKQITTPEEFLQFQRRYGLASAVSERDDPTDVFNRGGAMFYDEETGAPVAYAPSSVSRAKPEGINNSAVTSSRQMLDNLIGKKPEGQRVDATGLQGFAQGLESSAGSAADDLAALRKDDAGEPLSAINEDYFQNVLDQYGDFQRFGLRVIPRGYEVKIGDTLPVSKDWDNNIDTGVELEGTSAIGLDEGSVDWAIKQLLEAGYDGDQIVLIGGNNKGYGNDKGEVLISNARVIKDFSRPEKLAALTGKAPTETSKNKSGDPLGINIAVDPRNGTDYADLIVSGAKKFESRETASLKPYVGKRVGIVRTGAGQAEVIGSVEIGQPIEVNEKQFNELRDQHLVAEDSSFNIKKDQTKFLYPMINPTSTPPQKVTSKGIVARAVPTPAVPTETPEFKNFFGESKVTDAGGQPLVVYHGTGSDFTTFRPSESGLLGRGIYLSSEKRVAEGFRGADKLMPIYVSMKNPAYEHDLIPKRVGDKMKGDEYEKELHDRAIKGGFDGIIKGSSTDVFGNPRTPDSWGNFVVFEPTQIKSATDNVGTFDPSTPVITKAKGGTVTSSRRMLDGLYGTNAKGQRFANGGEARVGGSAPAVAGRTGRAAQLAAQRTADPQTESRTMLERLGRFTSLDTPPEMGLGETAADIGMGFLPVVGTAQGARDFERARRDEDKLGMLLSAASMIPVAGGAVRAVRSAGKAADVVEEVPSAARQMLDEVAPPATNEQIKQVESSAPAEKSPVPSYYMDEWTQETGLSPQEIENFWRLGDNQRGLPEHLMVKAQRELGGGVLFPAIEHIGDLTNRMTPKHSLGFAYEETLGKAQRYLRSLKSGYGFRREFEENLRNNAQFNNESLEEHRSKVNAALDAYADAHEKLVTYNPLQTLARDAAVSLGRRDFEKAATLLQDFVDRIPTREDFVAEMRFTPEPDLTKLSSRELKQKLQAIEEKRRARAQR